MENAGFGGLAGLVWSLRFHRLCPILTHLNNNVINQLIKKYFLSFFRSTGLTLGVVKGAFWWSFGAKERKGVT